MKAKCIFDHPLDPKIASDIATPIWYKFKLHELTQVMHQKDSKFAEILNVVHIGKPQANSHVDKMLKARQLTIPEHDSNYPHNALHVYAQNVHAYARNENILNHIPERQHVITFDDTTRDKNINIDRLQLPEVVTHTGNLHKKLVIKIGARVLLTSNLNVSDGLTNGVFGTVQYIHTAREEKQQKEIVTYILVKFDSERVGIEAKQKSLFKHQFPDAVPIRPIEVNFSFKNEKSMIYITRTNFPLSLGWAVTIHKVQGMTVDEIVVDMSENKGKYKMGQAYVALSQVRTYEKLHIINYNQHQIRISSKVHKEIKCLRKTV